MTDTPRGRLTQLSKLVSYSLRHRPWELELEPDAAGWVPVEQLVEALRSQPGWTSLEPTDLEAMIAAAPRQRHELQDGRIRALYGHSVPGHVTQAPELAPGTLFHGTARDAVVAIGRDGLLPRGRQYVHLATYVDLARQIGRRRDVDPVILEVDGQAALAAGVRFYRATDEIVLADHVPPAFIRARDGR